MNVKKIVATIALLGFVYLTGSTIIENAPSFPNEETLAIALFSLLAVAAVLGFLISKKL